MIISQMDLWIPNWDRKLSSEIWVIQTTNSIMNSHKSWQRLMLSNMDRFLPISSKSWTQQDECTKCSEWRENSALPLSRPSISQGSKRDIYMKITESGRGFVSSSMDQGIPELVFLSLQLKKSVSPSLIRLSFYSILHQCSPIICHQLLEVYRAYSQSFENVNQYKCNRASDQTFAGVIAYVFELNVSSKTD
jgi:hypothetical protein